MKLSKLGYCRAGDERLTLELDKPFSQTTWSLAKTEVDFFVKHGFTLAKNQWHHYSELIKTLPPPYTHLSIRLSDDGVEFVGVLMTMVEQINTYRNVLTNVTGAYLVHGRDLIVVAKEAIRSAIETIKEYNEVRIKELEKCLEEEDDNESSK